MSAWSRLTTLFLILGMGLTSCMKKTGELTPSDSAPVENVSATDEILVGEVGSLSGGEATFGLSTHKGIELAFNQVNQLGGVKGKKIRLLTQDDQGKPEEAATVITKLITQDKVLAVLGEVASSRSLAMAPIAQKNKTPMITPSSTNPKVTEIGDYISRVCFIDPFQGSVMAKFAANTLKVTKVAILRDVKNDYSVGLADFFTQTFQGLGGGIVLDQSYSAGDMDFKAQLTAIKGKAPQAIFVPGYYTEVALIAKQAKEIGLNVPLLGGDGWDSAKLTEIGGSALDGSYFSNHYSPDDQSEAVQKFIADFKAANNGEIPDGLAAMGYDAAMVLVKAMERATNLDRQAIKEAILQTKNHPGVTGLISLNEKRDAVKSAVVIEVKNKAFQFKEKIDP
jgi:branched-chain amino acid transport system substrate-binding protein